jgi:hypothetical protein
LHSSTSGHRPSRDGSVTVAELLGGHDGIEPVRRPGQHIEIIMPAPVSHRVPVHPVVRVAKAACLAAGGAVLCGCVVAGSVIASHRVPAVSGAQSAPAMITGASALRPDALAARLHAPAGRATRPSTRPAGTGLNAAPLATGRAAPQTTGEPRVEPRPQNPTDVVTEFYQRVVGPRPSSATNLLAPGLLEDTSDFLRSWSETTAVEIEQVQPQSDSSVLAIVRMLRPDGSWMRVQQLLHVTSGLPRLIDSVELLSAQRG